MNLFFALLQLPATNICHHVFEIIKIPKMTHCVYKLAYEKEFVTFGASFLVEISFK